MEAIKKNSKSIAIAAGVTSAVAVGLYLLFKRYSKKTSNLGFGDRPKRKCLTEKEKAEILSQVKISYNGAMLSPDTIAYMAEATRRLYAADCFNLMTENFKLRRTNKANFAFFVKTCEDFLNNMNNLSISREQEVLHHLGVSQADYAAAFQHYFNKGDPKVMAIEGDITERQALEAQPRKILTKEEFRKALIRNIELLETERFNLSHVQRMLKNPALAGTILYYKINDIVFEELDIEDQEFAVGISTYANDLDIEKEGLIARYIQATSNLTVY